MIADNLQNIPLQASPVKLLKQLQTPVVPLQFPLPLQSSGHFLTEKVFSVSSIIISDEILLWQEVPEKPSSQIHSPMKPLQLPCPLQFSGHLRSEID